jgi:DNA-binding NarL/FixJ family response regulator
VILSMRHDREHLATLPEKRAGGWSFLLKQSVADTSALVRAIEGAASGLVSMDPALIEDLYPRKRSALERLTQQQLSVLQFMAAGLADAAIAETLNMSQSGVERLIRTINEDLHIEADRRIDQRVKLILTYLRESSEHAGV